MTVLVDKRREEEVEVLRMPQKFADLNAMVTIVVIPISTADPKCCKSMHSDTINSANSSRCHVFDNFDSVTTAAVHTCSYSIRFSLAMHAHSSAHKLLDQSSCSFVGMTIVG